MAEIMGKQPKILLTDAQLQFYKRYQNYKQGTYVSDPYDTHSKVGNNTIAEEYQKVGIWLNIPQTRDKKEQILKTRSNMHRVRVHERCSDFISAIQNAVYPDVAE
jgi:DNA polymerase II large subunit